jgi:hypothetical protein
MVLPLPAGQVVGERPIGSDGRVNEAASLGEASRSCGVGRGTASAPGAMRDGSHRRYERNAEHFLAFASIACTFICYRRLSN